MAHAATATSTDIAWHRFTRGQRLARFVVYLVIVAAIVGVTGLLVRRASARDHLSTTSLSTSKKLQ